MRNRTLGTVAALVCLAPAGAWTPADAPLTLAPQSRLWVEGTSTVRSFTCKAAALESEIEGAPNAVAGVLGGEKAVGRVEFRVPSEKLDCGNGTMNEHMLKAIKAKEFKAVVFRVVSYEVAKGAEGVTGTLNGTLTLGGVEKKIAIEAAGRDAGAGALRVTGAHELRLSDYGLKAPTLMFGTMKVGDAVKVGFDLVLRGDAKVAAAN